MALIIYITFIIALAGVIAATITDLKSREGPNWLTFSLIAIALGTRLIYSLITSNFSYIISGIIYLGAGFVLANILYYGKIFAGGDSKLLIALVTLFAEPPKFSNFVLVFPLIILLNLLIAATI